MSRNYANISTAIWRNEEFRALTVGAQHMYLLLTSQPDISAAGVLPLSVKRWSNQSSGATTASVMGVLTELASHRFIVFDTETEELLVRAFVRWDGGHTNPKRRPVIERAAKDVESVGIRRSLAVEFKRLGLPDWLPDSLSGSLPDSPPTEPDAPSAGRESSRESGIADELSSQGNSLSDRQSPSDGVVVSKGLYVVPQPTTSNPQHPAPTALPDGATVTQRSKAITDAYTAVEPMSRWPAVNAIVIKAIEAGRWLDAEIHAAVLRLADDKRSVTIDSLRTELDGPPVSKFRKPASQLVERDGLMLSPRNVEAADRAARFAAMQAELDANPGQRAIEGITG